MTLTRCKHCRRDVFDAKDAIFQTDEGLEVRLKNACDDCVEILGTAIEHYLSALMN